MSPMDPKDRYSIAGGLFVIISDNAPDRSVDLFCGGDIQWYPLLDAPILAALRRFATDKEKKAAAAEKELLDEMRRAGKRPREVICID